MKKLLLLLIILLLSACNGGDRYNFSGDTDNWEVFYVIDVKGQDEQTGRGTINYVGQAPSPEKVSYVIDERPNKVGGNDILLEEGTVVFQGSSCSNCGIIQENQDIEVSINWNGRTETIILTND